MGEESYGGKEEGEVVRREERERRGWPAGVRMHVLGSPPLVQGSTKSWLPATGGCLEGWSWPLIATPLLLWLGKALWQAGVAINLRETPWVAWLAFGCATSPCWTHGHLHLHKQVGRDKLGKGQIPPFASRGDLC